jgi:hypothetical protein
MIGVKPLPMKQFFVLNVEKRTKQKKGQKKQETYITVNWRLLRWTVFGIAIWASGGLYS